MRPEILVFVLLLGQSVGAQPIVELDIDDYDDEGQFILVVHPVQTSLYGPKLPEITNGPMLGGLGSLWEDSLLWLIPDLINTGMDISSYREHQLSGAALADEHTVRFDYFGATARALNRLALELQWWPSPIYDIDFRSSLDGGWTADRHVRRVLRISGARTAVFLHIVYFVSPDLLQVRLAAALKSYTVRDSRSSILDEMQRHYEYLSAPARSGCNQWAPGQRKQVIEKMERLYKDRVAEFPHNEAAYRKDRRLALKAVEDRVEMPPAMAFTNCWPEETLTETLHLGIAELVEMIRADYGVLVPRSDRAGSKITFDGLSLKGKRKKFRGILMYEDHRVMVIRLENGDLYSVPKTPGNP